MHRINSSNPFFLPTPSDEDAAQSSESEDTKTKILWITGPEIDEDMHNAMMALLDQTNLNYIAYGDGKSSVSKENIKMLVRERLSDDGHIFFNCHGGYYQGKHYLQNQLGKEELTEQTKSDDFLTTDELPAFLQDQDTDQATQATQQRTIHIASCFSGSVRNLIEPDSAVWKQSQIFLYSSKKTVLFETLYNNVKASLEYITTCKSKFINENPLDLFLHITNSQSDCITLLGGELRAPLISHAPKSIHHLMAGRDIRLRGHEEDLKILSQRTHKTEKQADPVAEIKSNQVEDTLLVRMHRGDTYSVGSMLRMRPELIKIKDQFGSGLLMQALTESDMVMAEELLQHGADINEPDAENDTPLTASIIFEHLDFVPFLLERGASLSAKNMHGENALFCAAKHGQKKTVQLLLQYGAAQFINEKRNDGNTALMIAAKKGYVEIVKLLLAAGAKTNLKNNYRKSALSLAEEHNNLYSAELINRKIKSGYRRPWANEIHKMPENQPVQSERPTDNSTDH